VSVIFHKSHNAINLCPINRYVVENKSDDSILLILVIRIIDALGNYGIEFSIQLSFCILFEILIAHAQPNSVPFLNTGSLEYDEWSSHRQAWKLESAAIIEPPINFIVSSHSKGKKRYY
jgi:proteasome activator subunit 4